MSIFEITGDVLIEQAIEGDSNAFSSLYHAHAEKVFRHVSYRVPDKADAEDITQEVFIRAWRAVGRYRIGETPFISWLLAIAKNLIADFYRLRKNHVSLDDTTACASGIDLERDVETSLKKEELRIAISHLGKVKQKVLLMRFIEDRSYPEISLALGKSEGAVRVLVYRALVDLKKKIGSKDVP